MQAPKEIKPGHIGNLTPSQQSLLQSMRHFTHNELNLPKRQWNNWNILRFCRARKFDPEKVKKMITDFAEFSKEQKMDELGKLDLTHYESLRKNHVHGHYHTDKKGQPVYIERLSLFRASKVFEEYDTDKDLKPYFLQSYERLVHVILPACSIAKGERVERSVSIIDLNGVNAFKLFMGKTKAFAKIATEIAQNYYPELMANMYIVNSGYLFAGLWALVKPWIDVETQKKIIIKSGSGKKELLKAIDAENLPVFLGGTCEDELTDDPGVFHDAVIESRKEGRLYHGDWEKVEELYLDDEEKKEKEDLKQNETEEKDDKEKGKEDKDKGKEEGGEKVE